MANQSSSNSIATRSAGESYQVAAMRYAKLISKFAHLPDGRGANHALLTTFFAKLLSHSSASLELSQQKEDFAVSYTFEDDTKTAQGETRWILKKCVEYESCFDLVNKISSETSTPLSRLLFLRGFPSAQWLGLVGAKYKIDPEFFMRFLHFKPAKDATVNYSLPGLPATAWNILELPIITIGTRKVLPSPVDQAEIDKMRREARSRVQKHHDLLRATDGITVASSVVRDVAIIDHSCFALEQSIWICLQPHLTKKNDNTRWTLIVWTDTGRTPSVKSILDIEVLPKEFQTAGTSLASVIDYKPGTGLAAQKYNFHNYIHPVNGAEAASQLCVGYGQTLHEDIMATDPFYALTEVFNITTASVNQYLNLVAHRLAGFTDEEHYDNFDMLSNLRYTKDILYRQQRQIEQVDAWLKLHKLRGGSGWRTSGEEDPKASKTADSVVQRYEYLLRRVKTLQAQCQDANSNLMNTVNLKEIKHSYEQSKRTGKLTFLAFFFAPLSFTTSFFAMDIGLPHLTLKTWLVVTLILLGVTFFLMIVDVVDLIKRLLKRLHSATIKARYV